MLKTLIKLQFQKALARYTANSSNKKKNGKKSSFNSPAVYLALLAFVGVVFAFMFYNMFSMMAPMLATSGFSWLYFLYVMGASFVISTIGCIFLSLSQLYEAKDNELLLSMPIPPRSILFCRMLPLYAQNLLFCATCTGPCFCGLCNKCVCFDFACSKSDCDSAFSSAFKPERFVCSRLADCICNIKDKT